MKRYILALLDMIRRRTNTINYWKSKGLRLGKDCEIYATASFGSEPYLIELGDHVRVNSGVNFVTHDGGAWVIRNYMSEYKNVAIFGKIVIGNNVHIGTNAMIMPGVHIGNNCIIGACAVVTHDVPDNSVVAGVPARIIETIDDYIEKHINSFDYTKDMCANDKRKYLLEKYTLY